MSGRRELARFSALAAAVALGGCGDGDGLRVAAASSLSVALDPYVQRHGADIGYGGSDELAAQLRRGGAVDVYLAADEQLPAALHREGIVERPVVFAANELVLAVPAAGSVQTLSDAGRPGVRVAIGSRRVPVGRYARAALRGRGSAVLANVRSEEPSVVGIVGKLLRGTVDAGFVYRTDVRASGGRLRAIALPTRPRVRYAGAVVRRSSHRSAAARFLAGLRAARELRQAGFGVP